MFWIQLLILLGCIVLGARLGGIALGAVSGIGLGIFVFLFGLPPGGPPGVVVGMILAVITALAAMEAAGGLTYLVSVADVALRRKPERIAFVAPLVVFALVFAAGTTHVIYALLPVISEVSRKAGIRPERPLSISVIAGFLGAIASPISACTVAMLTALAGLEVSLPSILAISIPATLIGVVAGSLSVAWRGKPLDQDPEYRERLASGQATAPATATELSGRALTSARGSTLLFLAGITAVILIGIFPNLRPVYEVAGPDGIETDQVSMASAIMIVMFGVAGLILFLFRASPAKALKGSIMASGVSAVICIVGVAWLGSSFFEGNRGLIVGGISRLVEDAPWAFAFGLFALSSILFSSSATVTILIPVGMALRLSPETLIAIYPAAAGAFFLPTYGTVVAAVSFDSTGTTKTGSYLLNHSFMRPGLVAVATSVVVGLALGALR